MSITEGLHVPLIPLFEVVTRAGTVAPSQIVRLVPKLNKGVMLGLTETVNEVGDAHWVPLGVNVYVPEFWLSTTVGVHVPVIEFCDVVGKTGTVPPAQILRLVPKLKVGVVLGVTVTARVVVTPH